MVRLSAEERREQLLAAALRVMVRDGVEGATTRAIASEAGVHLATFHYCFASREELLREVATRLTDERVAAARTAFAHGRSLRRSITKSLETFWRGVEDAPGEELVGYELTVYALQQPDLQHLARAQYAHYLEVIEDFLQTAAVSADIEWTVPIKTLARYINAALDGLTISWLVDRDSAQSARVLKLVAAHLLSCARPIGHSPE